MLKKVLPFGSSAPAHRPWAGPQLFVHRFHSPLGTLIVVSDGVHVHAIDFGDYELRLRTLLKRRLGPVSTIEGEDPLQVEDAFRAYFKGDLTALESLPVAFTGTPFQNQVWQALTEIPPSATWTYAGLARRIGNPPAQRAVGFAAGQNPVAVAVPCHRVIGANGSLTGYAGGVARKRWLLDHEARFCATAQLRH